MQKSRMHYSIALFSYSLCRCQLLHPPGNYRRLLCGLIIALSLAACGPSEPTHPYQDITHFSKTFSREKYYRLYLPQNYKNDTTRYPVIYFFHGWGGRYRSDDNAKLAYDSLQRLVDKYRVLLVMWDGNVDESEPRPYNVGNHNDVRYVTQMKDYFPELVHHIDSTYRTLPGKWHRGIIGFSMGGFMSYYLAGKYPEMVGAAVGMTGSPEFFVGYPDNHTLYPLRYTFENLREVRLRFHNSTADELTYLNTEVKQGADWDGQVSFDYWQFEGGHMVDLPGKTQVFDRALAFVTQSFERPIASPAEWSHHDLYPQFDLYGYHVITNKKRPGFISLQHVKPTGFGISTKKWLPDGPSLDSVTVEVITAPLYPPNAMMHVVKMRTDARVAAESNMKADNEGRLHFFLDGASYELGIAPAGSPTVDVIAVDYEMAGTQRFLRPGDNPLRISLLNRGGARKGQEITLSISATDSTITLTPTTVTVPQATKRMLTSGLISVNCNKTSPENAAPPFARVRIAASVDGVTNNSELVIPILFDAPAFENLAIDDNRKINDSTQARGQGNGDGIIDPGERVVIYVDGRPLKLYSDNAHVTASREEVFDIMVPAKWPDGFTVASIVKISENCPSGTEIEFLGNYETKEFMPVKRTVHWGTVRVRTGRPNQ
ncbi:MAG TPA: alpha/beta fold hydrolase [Chryseolinea sp.]|nr:alpha/beta fold hydrolase [Chryseolinea sp.]